MRRIRIPRLRFYQLLIPAAIMALIIGVACAGAEETTPSGDSGSTGSTDSGGAAAPVGATATPLPTQEPAAAVDTGEGKTLTVLTESFGNEVWDPKFESGDKHVWHFPLHSHMITLDEDFNFSRGRLGDELGGFPRWTDAIVDAAR